MELSWTNLYSYTRSSEYLHALQSTLREQIVHWRQNRFVRAVESSFSAAGTGHSLLRPEVRKVHLPESDLALHRGGEAPKGVADWHGRSCRWQYEMRNAPLPLPCKCADGAIAGPDDQHFTSSPNDKAPVITDSLLTNQDALHVARPRLAVRSELDAFAGEDMGGVIL